MSEQIRKNRNDYMRMWRKKNKDKVKEINKRYYQNKVVDKKDSLEGTSLNIKNI